MPAMLGTSNTIKTIGKQQELVLTHIPDCARDCLAQLALPWLTPGCLCSPPLPAAAVSCR
jgi:hypothetical protein